MDEIIDTLKRLSEAMGVSGFEDEPRALIHSEIKDSVDKTWIDPLGNLLAIKKGQKNHPRILLDAHMDEVGFMIKHINDEGFLRFVKIGGWDDRILLGHPVVIQTEKKGREKVFGVIGSKPPHLSKPEERTKVITADSMFIDVGATNKDEVLQLGIQVGTPAVPYHPFTKLEGGAILGKAFDDRTGCTVLIHVLKKLVKKDHDPTILFNFSVREEVGAQGALTGAYTLEPDVALALENTTAADTPGIAPKDCPTKLKAGPAITVADRSLLADRRIIRTLQTLAEKNKIPWQIKKPLYGGTDAGRIAVARGGVPAGVVSVPCRYIHSPLALLYPSDIKYTIDLVYEFLLNWK